MNKKQNDWKRYVVVFLITASIFLTGLWFSGFMDNKRIDQLKSIENTISLDLQSSEIQFSLLEELSCEDITSSTVLSSELNTLAEKLSYSEDNMGVKNEEVINLKKYYSLLQIKDYLLMKKITERCGQEYTSILYFYKNTNCNDCTKQGYVLTALRERYPRLRVYSFDYNLDFSAIKAMISIYKIPDNLPALVIDGHVLNGFKSIEEIEQLVPELLLEKTEEEGDKNSGE